MVATDTVRDSFNSDGFVKAPSSLLCCNLIACNSIFCVALPEQITGQLCYHEGHESHEEKQIFLKLCVIRVLRGVSAIALLKHHHYFSISQKVEFVKIRLIGKFKANHKRGIDNAGQFAFPVSLVEGCGGKKLAVISYIAFTMGEK